MRLYFVIMFLEVNFARVFGELELLQDVLLDDKVDISGIAVTDLDNDGQYEAIIAVVEGANMIIRFNQILGKYETINDDRYKAIEDSKGRTVCACTCDVDGDGVEEIFLLNDNDVYSYKERIPSRLLKRSALIGQYKDIFLLPENIGKAPDYGGTAAACVDVDGDGLYEIVFSTFTKDGRGIYQMLSVRSNIAVIKTFMDESGYQIERVGRGILVGPMIGADYFCDIFITNDNSFIVGSSLYRHKGSNVLLRNQGNGTFQDDASVTGLEDSDANSFGAALSDLNNDGIVDFLVSNWMGPTRAYIRYENNEEFVPLLDDTVTRSKASKVILGGDLNNDGKADILMTDGEPNEENTQLLTVNEVGNSSVRTLPGYQVPEQNSYSIQTKGAAAADLNGDGFVEILLTQNGANSPNIAIFQEHATRVHEHYNWIRFYPKTKFGAPARGAMVIVSLSDFSKRSIVIGGECSHMCQSEPVAHFGLGKAFAKEVIVVWPGGHKIKHFLKQSDNKRSVSITYWGEIKHHNNHGIMPTELMEFNSSGSTCTSRMECVAVFMIFMWHFFFLQHFLELETVQIKQ